MAEIGKNVKNLFYQAFPYAAFHKYVPKKAGELFYLVVLFNKKS